MQIFDYSQETVHTGGDDFGEAKRRKVEAPGENKAVVASVLQDISKVIR